MSTANVRSVAAIADFRVALATYGDEVNAGLCDLDMEIRRFQDWLQHEQAGYWQREMKKREQNLSEAKSDLLRARISGMSATGQTHSHIELEAAVKRAQRRLEEAEQKIMAVKKWTLVVQQAIGEYQTQSRPMATELESDLPKTLAMLDRMVKALEDYVGGSAMFAEGSPFEGIVPTPAADSQTPAEPAVPPADTTGDPPSADQAADENA